VLANWVSEVSSDRIRRHVLLVLEQRTQHNDAQSARAQG